MVVKSKTKTKRKIKAAVKVKSPARKKLTKPVAGKKPQIKRTQAKTKAIRKAASKTALKTKASVKKSALAGSFRAPSRRRSSFSDKPVEVTRSINLTNQIRQPVKPVLRRSSVNVGSPNLNVFNFMKAPRPEYAFEVGDGVDVFCDHEKGRERVRGWIKGIVVQVDNKMVAVQFRSNVFLTDGWMVPDRILWYPLNSEHIRPASTGKKPAVKKEIIPDY